VTKDLDFSLADRKAELLRWLSEDGRFAPDTGGLLEMLCEKLTVLGAPIARATVHVRTLHPEFRGVTRIWRRGQSTEIRTSRHGIESTSDYQNSPVQYVIAGSTGRRNTGVKSLRWGFKLQGLTGSFVELTSHFVQIGL
jgi:adenylate cyclase